MPGVNEEVGHWINALHDVEWAQILGHVQAGNDIRNQAKDEREKHAD